MNGSGHAKKKGVHVFHGWVSLAVTRIVSLTPYEHNIGCTCGFSQAGTSSVRLQDEGQPMNPDDVQVLEEVGDDGAIPAKHFRLHS